MSDTYICNAMPICFSLFMQKICCALALACARAGRSMAARMAMMAITTSNSISVKPYRLVGLVVFIWMDSLGSVTTVNGDTSIHPEKINAKMGVF